MSARALVRRLLSATFYQEGTVRTILWGPCRGLRYRIFRDYGLSPLYGGWEPDAQQLMIKYLDSNSIAYDLGANYGMHTLLMAKRSAHVYAFEPMAEIRRQLEHNIVLNRLGNVTVLPLAVCEETTTQRFDPGGHDGAGHLIREGDCVEHAHSVHTISLDDFVFVHGNRAPTFMKVDVEGAESRVLLGAERVLQDARPTILLDLHSPTEDVAVGKVLSAHHYAVYRTGKTGVMSRVTDLTKGWPSPAGLWGQIIAFPS